MSTGVGLYVHTAKRRKQAYHAKSSAPGKEGAAEAGDINAKSASSPPPLPIAQSQQPYGGLFEPVGCPRLSTPGGLNQSSFMHSITSSNRSRSQMAAELRPYPSTAAPAAINLQAIASQEYSQAAQHTQQPLPTSATAAFSKDPLHSMQSVVSQSWLHTGYGQQAASHAPFTGEMADDLLSQEAAAADAVMDTLSLMSGHDALHSRTTQGLITGFGLDSCHVHPPEAQGTPVGHLAPGQEAAKQCEMNQSSAQQHQSEASECRASGRLAVIGVPKPQQGYPGGSNTSASGLPFGRNGQSPSEAQVGPCRHLSQ